MALTLTPETEALIQQALDSGRFASADALIRTAISVLSDEEFVVLSRSELNAKLEESFAAADRGETISSEDFEAEMDLWRASVSA